jgi:multidrug efflux pump subunit AcrB
VGARAHRGGAVNGVIYGVVISSVIALVCLLIFTSNFLVALLAIFSQIATMFSTLAMYWLAGWTMGVIEAISITVLVGLSIDYFFHLAEAYSVSGDYGRRERTRDALTRMGISVLAGAITTAGSVALVLGAQIEIFFKFGLIVVVNTLFSIVWVYVFFCAYLTTVGPSGDFGSMKRLWRMIGGSVPLQVGQAQRSDALKRAVGRTSRRWRRRTVPTDRCAASRAPTPASCGGPSRRRWARTRWWW